MMLLIWPTLSSNDPSLSGATGGAVVVVAAVGLALLPLNTPEANRTITTARTAATTPPPTMSHLLVELGGLPLGGCCAGMRPESANAADDATGDGPVLRTAVGASVGCMAGKPPDGIWGAEPEGPWPGGGGGGGGGCCGGAAWEGWACGVYSAPCTTTVFGSPRTPSGANSARRECTNGMWEEPPVR